MSIDAVDKAGGLGTVAPDAERQQIARLAREFEAMLMTQMLREMRRTMLEDPSHDPGLGNEAMTDTLDIELGQALSRVGGFGLSSALGGALEKRLGTKAPAAYSTNRVALVSPASILAPPAPLIATPGRADVQVRLPPAGLQARTTTDEQVRMTTDDQARTTSDEIDAGEPDLQMPRGAITSRFGWRRDPIDGAVKFHKGIDVAQPYGHEVRAAAPGHVIATGDQGAYGTTIVVDHGGGQQTRYAHLSASAVRVGERVEGGQIIGKTGDSGRTTGPHLHFEVVENGRVVDPTTF